LEGEIKLQNQIEQKDTQDKRQKVIHIHHLPATATSTIHPTTNKNSSNNNNNIPAQV
jgi:hypothetical protein